MDKYNFDQIIARENTDCVKYDKRQETFGRADVLPLWVADMDFATPDFIRYAVIERAAHEVYGYSFMSDAYFQAIVNWVKSRHQWVIKKDWISFSPGVVPAIHFAIQTFSEKGDGIIVQPPVYFPFFDAIHDNHRQQLDNLLIRKPDGTYHIDFDDLEEKAKKAKILILSHPHNPVSRCWTREELKTMGEICVRNQVIIISDEIHNDLILPGFKHYPMATLSDEIANMTITCIAPSKTFNIAGLSTSSVIISNPELRKQYRQTLKQHHILKGNFFGMVASTAGYTKGGPWVDALMQYVKENFGIVSECLKNELPDLKLTPPEATFLAWIDFSGTGLSDKEIKDKLVFEAGLGLSHGPVFGPGGEGFQRMNLAAPKKIIQEACERLVNVFKP